MSYKNFTLACRIILTVACFRTVVILKCILIVVLKIVLILVVILIPYLSNHKIRFTETSMPYDAGLKAIDIQPLLGHSTLHMTQHYIGERVREQDNSQMAQILG